MYETVLAIDPGIEKVGYSIFHISPENTKKFCVSGLIKTSKHDRLEVRLGQIRDALQLVIREYAVNALVMEQLFFFKNAKTVITVAQAQGAMIALAAEHHLTFQFLTPLQIKMAITGDGRADKSGVHRILQMELGTLTVADDDESDAIACGYAYCLLQKSQKMIQ